MRIIVLGADGYLGWPTTMYLAARGHHVLAIDNYLKRSLARAVGGVALNDPPLLGSRCQEFKRLTGIEIEYRNADCTEHERLRRMVRDFKPDAIIHYAEQPSAPYSMINYDTAKQTLDNNLHSTLALAHAVIKEAPDAHIVKLGTMGEYGTPNVPIMEGWLDLELNGRKQRFLYPSEPGSLYHVTKVQDTHMLWLYAKTHGLRVTDIMQGPVYGLETDETLIDDCFRTCFHYDSVFGTVINRFVVQAVAGEPLTVYGAGGQTRGFIALRDVMRCIELIIDNPAEPGELRILNQITSVQSVQALAIMVCRAAKTVGIEASIDTIENPRLEAEDHYFNVEAKGLKELGLVSSPLSEDSIISMIEAVRPLASRVDHTRIRPLHQWRRP